MSDGPEDQWLSWSKQLLGIAQTGLHFGESEYDRERYQQIADIAQAMLASITNAPIQRVLAVLADGEIGYRTPKVDVRAAIFRDQKILLVKEKTDGLWTLPGGYADIGLSPSENIIKEVEEEAGIQVKVDCLYCLRHKAKHEYDVDIRDFYKMYFLCSEDSPTDLAPGYEVSAADFFKVDQLPPLSTGRVLVKDIELAFSQHQDYSNRTLIPTIVD